MKTSNNIAEEMLNVIYYVVMCFKIICIFVKFALL